MVLKTYLNFKARLSQKSSRPSHRYIVNTKLFDSHFFTSRSTIVIKTVDYGRVYDREISAFVKFLSRNKQLKRRLYIRAYPYLPLTKKPAEVRMGKGKGAKIDAQAKPVGPGVILAEIRLRRRLSRHSAFFLDCLDWLKRASSRFSVRTRVALSDF